MNYEKIQQQFEEVIRYSQDKDLVKPLPNLELNDLFTKWYKNKSNLRHFLPFFDDNKYIYEHPIPVSFGLDENARMERLTRFINGLWDYPYLQDFLKINKPNFFENRVTEDYKAPRGTARRGMKIIKAFKLFFENGDEELKRLQSEASVIMNEDKIEGTFCISIHPLDYISISDNDHKWHSCHSMDSDYRAGNLSYMIDKHTVICYIKTGEDRKINNFPKTVPWNSKCWRVLLYFDRECNFVMASRQYPIQSQETLDFFQTAFKSLRDDYSFGPWHKEQISSVNVDGYEYKFSESMIPVGRHMAPIRKIYKPKVNSLQYNDILINVEYNKEVRYAYLTSKSIWSTNSGIIYDKETNLGISGYLFTNKELPLIEPGEEVNCLACGMDVISTSETVLCDHCTMKYYNLDYLDAEYFPCCDCCGERFINYEGRWYDGQILCPECARCYDKEEE